MQTRVLGFVGLALCATAQAGPTALTVKDAAAGQGNGAYTPLLFTIERTGDLSYPIELEFESAPDPDAAHPAGAGVDFISTYVERYVLPAGQARPTIPVSLLRAGPARPDRGIEIRLEGGRAPPFRARQEVCPANNTRDAAVADFNGDGHADLALVQNDPEFQTRASLCLSQGGDELLAFDAPQDVSLDVYALAAGDLDGDARPDLVLAGAPSNSLYFLLNRTPPGAAMPSFAAPQLIHEGHAVGNIELADFNGDGRLDIAAGGAQGTCHALDCSDGTSEVQVFFNTTVAGGPGLAFEPIEPILVPMFVQEMVAADFDADGRTDLAVASNSNGVDLLRNTTPGAGAPPAFAPRQVLLTSQWTSGLATADFNRDGRPDLVAVHMYQVVILTNEGAGEWSEPRTVYVEPKRASGHQEQPYSVAAGDFSGDGLPDLAIGHYLVHTTDVNGFGGDDTLVALFLNRTRGNASDYRFTLWGEPAVSGVPFRLRLADLNGDGRDDLIAPSMFEGYVTVLAHTDHEVEFAQPVAKGTALATLPPLEFAAVDGAPASATVTSQELTVTGIAYDAPIAISQGAYSINGGPLRTGTSKVRAGDVVRIEVESASAGSAETKASLMIGGVTGEFAVRTAASPPAAAGGGGGAMGLPGLVLMLLAGLARGAGARRR